MGGLIGVMATAQLIAAAITLSREEQAGHLSLLLAAPLTRTRFYITHLAVAAGGTAIVLTVAGAGMGVVLGLRTGRLGQGLGQGLAATVVQLPAVLVIGGVCALLVRAAPRAVTLAWLVLGGSLLLGQLGGLLEMPPAVLRLSPFTHLPRM